MKIFEEMYGNMNFRQNCIHFSDVIQNFIEMCLDAPEILYFIFIDVLALLVDIFIIFNLHQSLSSCLKFKIILCAVSSLRY